jgi:AcrR family transcriptional regulator
MIEWSGTQTIPSAGSAVGSVVVGSRRPTERHSSAVRRAEIIDAALTVFMQKGYHGTTVKDIANVLAIKAPSLYNHVKSKQEILQDIMFNTMDALNSGFDVAIASTEDLVEQLRRATEFHVSYHARYRREAHVGNREIASLDPAAQSLIRGLRRTYEHKWRELVERGVAGGQFVASSPRLASYAILEMGVGVALWFRPDGELNEAAVVQTYGEMALRLLSAVDGITAPS